MARTMKQWKLVGTTGFDNIVLDNESPVPRVGERDVLVKFCAASLNYRDLMLAQGTYPVAPKESVVPASDGAGIVEAVGSRVTKFRQGDRVVTVPIPGHVAGLLDSEIRKEGIGGTMDGTLRQYGIFEESGLVLMPSNLNFIEGATLTCSAITAWNALYGLADRRLMPGDWVLVQGTGGVSTFALQFAKAAGAKVIATTSSRVKSDKLKALGADCVINYKENTNWGLKAREVAGFRGVRHIIEVGGSESLHQSLAAIGTEGVISIIGALDGLLPEKNSVMLGILITACLLRGIVAGSRQQFEEMNRAIEAHDIKPVIDERVFGFDEVREAYDYMWSQKHFGKIGIKVE